MAADVCLSPRPVIAALGCACAGAGALLFFFDPSHHSFYPTCPVYQATGFYCAGCGATRALYALLHGRVGLALHDNLLFSLLLPLVAGLGFTYFRRAWHSGQWPSLAIGERSLWRAGLAFLALGLVFCVLRNLPGAPFDLLRPLPG